MWLHYALTDLVLGVEELVVDSLGRVLGILEHFDGVDDGSLRVQVQYLGLAR